MISSHPQRGSALFCRNERMQDTLCHGQLSARRSSNGVIRNCEKEPSRQYYRSDGSGYEYDESMISLGDTSRSDCAAWAHIPIRLKFNDYFFERGRHGPVRENSGSLRSGGTFPLAGYH